MRYQLTNMTMFSFDGYDSPKDGIIETKDSEKIAIDIMNVYYGNKTITVFNPPVEPIKQQVNFCGNNWLVTVDTDGRYTVVGGMSNETKTYLSNHLAHKTLGLINLVCDDWQELGSTKVIEINKEIGGYDAMARELGITSEYQERLSFHCVTYGIDSETVGSVMECGLFSVIGVNQ